MKEERNSRVSGEGKRRVVQKGYGGKRVQDQKVDFPKCYD